jgi:hypothetical protein
MNNSNTKVEIVFSTPTSVHLDYNNIQKGDFDLYSDIKAEYNLSPYPFKIPSKYLSNDIDFLDCINTKIINNLSYQNKKTLKIFKKVLMKPKKFNHKNELFKINYNIYKEFISDITKSSDISITMNLSRATGRRIRRLYNTAKPKGILSKIPNEKLEYIKRYMEKDENKVKPLDAILSDINKSLFKKNYLLQTAN